MAAKALLEQAGLALRCAVVGGDFFQSVPKGGDLYLMRRIMHGWSDEGAIAILRNCREAMGPDARLLVIEHVLAPGNAPSWGKMLDLQQLVFSAGGRERSEAEYAGLLAAAGFELERVIPTVLRGKPHRGDPGCGDQLMATLQFAEFLFSPAVLRPLGLC